MEKHITKIHASRVENSERTKSGKICTTANLAVNTKHWEFGKKNLNLKVKNFI